MPHADILVPDGYQKREAGPFLSKYETLNLCRTDSNIPTSRWYGMDIALYRIINSVATQ